MPPQKIIDLQNGAVYGPVSSRRLGRSLGINLSPWTYKLCSYNCAYCQYGWTSHDRIRDEDFIPAAQIVSVAQEKIQALKEKEIPLDCFTLAGNGEPTLHPGFCSIVRGVLDLRNRFYPNAGVGILSNSSTVHRADIREALSLLDSRYMKLDAGTSRMFQRLNHPLGAVDWDQMVEGLRLLKKVTLQSLFVQGSVDNTAPEALDFWMNAVKRIAPIAVHIYTVQRGTADPGIIKVSRERLEEIACLLQSRTGISAAVCA